MGYKLRRWLADRLPADLSSGERLVALEIADQANDKTRLAYGKELLDKVVHRTGLSSQKQVGKVLGKLAARGIELRVPARDKDGQIVTDKAGRPVFAWSGHKLNFRVPSAKQCPALVSAPHWETPDPESSPARETFTPERSPSGETNSPERSPARGQKVPPAGDPSPQSPHNHLPSAPASPAMPEPVPGGGGGQQQQDQLAAVAAFLEQLPAPWTVGPRSAIAMAPLLRDMAARQGWKLDAELTAELTKNPGSIRDHPRVIPRRIGDLPKRAKPVSTRTLLNPWCGMCADDNPLARTQGHLRLVITDRGDARPCPTCHPSAIRAA